MTDLYVGAYPLVNFDALDKELRAALPGKLDGIKNNAKNGDLWVIVSDGIDGEPLRPTIAAVIAAHDPTKLTDVQKQEIAKAAAEQQLKGLDFAALRSQVEKAATLEDARPMLLAALDVVFKVALAAGVVDISAQPAEAQIALDGEQG